MPVSRADKTISSRVFWLALILFAIFFGLAMTKVGAFTLDETMFHYPNLLNFYENGLSATFNSRYSAANTPLPYIIVAGIARLTGPSLVLARVITGIVSFLTLLVAIRLLRRHGAYAYAGIVILFYPYFFLNSFVFYVVNYGLFFGLLGLLVLDPEKMDVKETNTWWRDLLGGLCLSAAVLCQQFYLVVPAAIALVRTVFALRRTPPIPALIKTSIANILLVLPLILPAIIFIKWGGLTHPNFRFHEMLFGPTTITAIFFVVGLYLLPYLIQTYKRINAVNLGIAFVVAVLLVIFFRPGFSDIQGEGKFTGMTLHLMTMAGKISPIVTMSLMTVLATCGILVLLVLLYSLSSAWDYSMFLSCVFFAITYIISSKIGERHLLAMMIFLLLMVLPRIRKPVASWYPWAMGLVGAGYFFYWTFLKFGSA